MLPRPDENDDPRISEHIYFAQQLPRDAELMGLDRNTQEGAMIAMSGSLRSDRVSHRLIAWVVVLALTLPLLLTLLSLVF